MPTRTKDLVLEMHGELRAAYRSQQWDADTDRLYARILGEINSQFGPTALTTAVRDCIKNEPWLDVVKLRSHIPHGGEGSSSGERCGDCVQSSGFLYFDADDQRIPYRHAHGANVHHVRRCSHSGAAAH